MESVNSKLIKIRKDIDKSPTEGQKESGNYKKGHISINGFKITIENPKGTYRKGVDSNGKEWKTKMNNDYGYFLNSEGYDGDHVDVFLGGDFESEKIFVVDQKKGNKFDESKVMLGFNTEKEAKNAYLSNFEKGWNGFHKITEVSINDFKEWLYDGKKQRKPFYQYKDIKKNTKKMKIKENVLRQLIQESINKVIIKEGRESTKLTNILIKKLYKVAQNYKKKYHDDDWSNVKAMFNEMEQLEGVASLFPDDGRYRKYGEGLGETTKIYKVNILTDFNTIINGNVNCHLCGTIDNPWSAYDISVSFYRGYGDKEIQESISINENVDNENIENIYTMDDWSRDGSIKLKIGQYIDDDVFEELANSVPPTTYKSLLFQPGEAYTMSKDYEDLYMTFVNDGNWKYVGLCPKGSNKRQLAYDEEEYLGESIIRESRGLKSMKLFQIAKEHGGLKPRHYTSTRYFNELTDDDVIGIVEKPELNRYENASWPIRAQWASEKGYEVKRGDDVIFIPMADYTWVAIIERGSLLPDKEWVETPHGKKVAERDKNRWNDGKISYKWSDSNERGFSKRSHDFTFKKIKNDEKNFG